MLMIYPPADAPPAGDPAEQLARWQDYTVSLEEAGVVVTHARLQDAHAATTVRVRDGERLVNDGPFAETKEYLAGSTSSSAPTSTRRSAMRRGCRTLTSRRSRCVR
jgi:hypothetical protein